MSTEQQQTSALTEQQLAHESQVQSGAIEPMGEVINGRVMQREKYTRGEIGGTLGIRPRNARSVYSGRWASNP